LEFLDEATVAPITSTVRDIPSETPLDESDGMPRACAVNLDHIQTVTKKKLGPLITRLSHAKMNEVDQALVFALGVRSRA
jgi:mRNA interferase MazF